MSTNVETLTPCTQARSNVASLPWARIQASLALLVYGATQGFALANDARAVHSLAEIRSAAEDFVRTAAQSSTGTPIAAANELDPRLQFAACGGPLQTFALQGATIGARNTIGVRCSIGAEWTLYVPVALSSEVDVLVLQSAAARDTQLGAADIAKERRRVPGLGSTYIGNLDALAHKRTKRSLPAGTVLTVDMFKRELAVKRGQQVSLVTNAGGLEVRAFGVAMNDGGLADRVRVQNLSSLKVVEGVVESGNLVRVGM